MADTTTTNLALVKPEAGASTDTWGDKINAGLDALDGLFAAGPVLLLAKGGTGAADAATARANFGLGTMATQGASGVAITGGTMSSVGIENSTIGLAAPSTAEFTYVRIDNRLTLATAVGILFGDGTTQITAAGTFTAGVQSITASTTLAVTYQDHTVKVDATSGAVTVNLFTAVGNAGKRITVKKMDSGVNTVTIDAASSETIDGSLTTPIFRQYDAVTLVCDGAGWLQT